MNISKYEAQFERMCIQLNLSLESKQRAIHTAHQMLDVLATSGLSINEVLLAIEMLTLTTEAAKEELGIK